MSEEHVEAVDEGTEPGAECEPEVVEREDVPQAPPAPSGPEMITIEMPDEYGGTVPVEMPKDQYDLLAIAGYRSQSQPQAEVEDNLVEDDNDPVLEQLRGIGSRLENVERRFFQTDMVDAAQNSELAKEHPSFKDIISEYATALMASDRSRSLSKQRAASLASQRLSNALKGLGGGGDEIKKYLSKKVKSATSSEGGGGGGAAMAPKRNPATKEDLRRGRIAQRLKDRIAAEGSK